MTWLPAGRFEVWILQRERNSSLLQNVQIGSGTRPACYSMNIGDYLHGGKVAGARRNYPDLSIAKGTNKRTYASTFAITISVAKICL